jgi:hypothetical protein
MSSIPGFAFLMAVLWKRAIEASEPYELFSRITARVMFGAMALTLLVASIVFYNLAAEPSLAQTTTAIVIAFGLFVVALKMPSWKDSMSAIGALSLMAAIGYSTTMVAGDAYLSTHRSTKNILSYATSLAPGQHLNIGFANNLPFSARFYSALMRDPTVKVSQIQNEAVPQAPEDLIIVRKNKGDTDVVMKDPTKEKIGELGRWRVYKPKQP